MRTVLIISAIMICSCISTPKNPESDIERQVNACLPSAITMREGLVKSGVWSDVLLVHWTDTKPRGHAYAIYLYPPGKNKLWAYDRDWGSIRVRAFKDNPMAVAVSANASRNIYGKITSAEYLK